MTAYVSPKVFYQSYQDHGDKARIYISDSFRGGRFVDVDRVTYEGGVYYIVADGSKVAWSGQELIVDKVRTPVQEFQPLFGWYMDDYFQRDLIGYDQTLQDFFEDSYELNKITISATLRRIINACDQIKTQDVIKSRAAIIQGLAYAMENVDSGEYDLALAAVEDITGAIQSLQRDCGQ